MDVRVKRRDVTAKAEAPRGCEQGWGWRQNDARGLQGADHRAWRAGRERAIYPANSGSHWSLRGEMRDLNNLLRGGGVGKNLNKF